MALLALSSGLMIVLAGNVDKCTEKFNACKTTCTNLWHQCKTRGAEIDSCNSQRKQCEAGCDADLKKCQGNTKPVSPAKPKPKEDH